MKRYVLAAALLLLGVDLAYGQTCQAYLNGAKARASKDKWEDANQVLGEHMDMCADEAEYRYFYGITLARVSPDSTAKAMDQVRAADSLNGNPGSEDELQQNIDQAMTAMWGPLVNEGLRLLAAGKLDQAEEKLKLAVDLNPEGKEGQLGFAAVHHARKDYDQAIEHYRKALEIDPDYKLALLRLGQVYQLQADQFVTSGDSVKVARATDVAGQAVTVYQDYLEENPDDLDVQIQLAGLYATLGEMEKASPVIEEIMESETVGADVLTDFGFRLANAGQDELAEEVLGKAVVLSDSLWTEPLSYLSFVKIRQGELEEAKAVLEKQVELDPSNAEAWENLGYVRRDLGDSQAAQEAFQKAQDIPLDLEGVTMSQNPDSTWNADITFSNRTENPVQKLTVEVSLVSPGGEVIETKQTTVAPESLPAGQAERVRVEFDSKAQDPRIRFQIL